MAKLAANLKTLRDEIDARWPDRDRETDGWIASPTHPRPTDHLPDARGIVHAIDVDRDGIDAKLVVRKAIAHDSVQYVIFDRTIWSRTHSFRARVYNGVNPHTSHIHISGRKGTEFENDASGFGIVRIEPGSRVLVLRTPRMSGADVTFVQRELGQADAGPADGVYGPKTKTAVEKFQKKHNLDPTGKVGPKTWKAFGVTFTG